MAFQKLSYEKDWKRAEDFPAYQSDEAQVRADMQYHPDAVRNYVNGTLLPALEGKTAAGELGAADESGGRVSVQSVLDSHREELTQLREDIVEVAGGGVPVAAQCTAVEFFEESWATVGGSVTLTIPKSSHKRDREDFGYNLYQMVDGTYRSGTWGTASTRVAYSSGSITLTADEAYSGKIVFFGL